MLSFQFCFARLSFISITPLRKYQRKFLIFKRAFRFHNLLLRLGVSKWIKARYCDLTENYRFGTKLYQNSSCSSDSTTLTSHENSSFHGTNLGPIKSLRQDRFKGKVLTIQPACMCLNA
jgi:hypothetical protein